MALINSKELNKLKEEYQNTLHNQIGEYQLRQLNLLWQEAYSTIPYYRELKTQQKLPGVFESLEQYISEMPILTKTILQNPTILTYSRNRPIDYYRITGGSTASPIQIPAWKSERKSTHLVPWVGRSWYHIHPKDKLFLYWGHSHLLGSGIRGKLNGFIREIRDFFQNYVRYSCSITRAPGGVSLLGATRGTAASGPTKTACEASPPSSCVGPGEDRGSAVGSRAPAGLLPRGRRRHA